MLFIWIHTTEETYNKDALLFVGKDFDFDRRGSLLYNKFPSRFASIYPFKKSKSSYRPMRVLPRERPLRIMNTGAGIISVLV